MMDGWRRMVDQMEDLALHPDAEAADIEEARERLSKVLDRVRLVPEKGQLVAEVGLSNLGDTQLYMPFLTEG